MGLTSRNKARWPSGLRRHVKELPLIPIFTDSVVRKGVGSNPTLVITFALGLMISFSFTFSSPPNLYHHPRSCLLQLETVIVAVFGFTLCVLLCPNLVSYTTGLTTT